MFGLGVLTFIINVLDLAGTIVSTKNNKINRSVRCQRKLGVIPSF